MNVTIETKVCTKCGEDKPLSEYPKRKVSKDGHRNDCKVCRSAERKAYREANREKVSAGKKAYREDNREKVAAYQKAHYEANREKIKAAKKAYYEANREKKKAYYEANREKVAAYQKAHYEANRDEIAAWQKAYRAERWANDPEYRAKVYASNLLRKRLQPGAKQEPYTREEIFARDNWICGLCEEPIDPELRHPDRGFASIDHIVPISLGGDDTPANVQAAHLSCNTAKGNRVELEDLQSA